MLGRFIIPAGKLADLPTLSGNWHFSILGRSGSNAAEFAQGLEEDLSCLTAFRKTQTASADVFEVRLPTTILTSFNDQLELLNITSHKLTDQNKLTAYYEITMDEAWRENMQTAIHAISQHNQQTGHRNGFKLRCGGVVASAFPSAEQIAHALILCREHNVPIKATAGLHHPIRHYNESVLTKMHGFINVFGAGLLAHAHTLTLEQTATIINDEDPSHFTFAESSFSWKDLSVNSAQIRSTRGSALISYGSCSFDEPRDDMKKLGWL
jgi:hypothetical protein